MKHGWLWIAIVVIGLVTTSAVFGNDDSGMNSDDEPTAGPDMNNNSSLCLHFSHPNHQCINIESCNSTQRVENLKCDVDGTVCCLFDNSTTREARELSEEEKKQVNTALDSGREELEKRDELEKVLKTKDLFVKPYTSEGMYNEYLNSKDNALDAERDNYVVFQAVKYLSYKLPNPTDVSDAVQKYMNGDQSSFDDLFANFDMPFGVPNSETMVHTQFSNGGQVVESNTNYTNAGTSGDFVDGERQSQTRQGRANVYSAGYGQSCAPVKYRSVDGSCNNLKQSHYGKAFRVYNRLLAAEYGDGVSAPRKCKDGSYLPSARLVSSQIVIDKSNVYRRNSLMTMQWGQFIDHEMSFTPIYKARGTHGILCCAPEIYNNPKLLHPECYPIQIPDNDYFYKNHRMRCMEFVRSLAGPTSYGDKYGGKRQQLNQVSSYIDGSLLYGSSYDELKVLRSYNKGLLKSQLIRGKEYIPLEIDRGCTDQSLCVRVIAGDSRANQHPWLTVMHNLFLRAHNYYAYELAKINPHWDDEYLYQETRRIIAAQLQHITYSEFLPSLFGYEFLNQYGLGLKKYGYSNDYDEYINAATLNEFTAAAFRVGHSLIYDTIRFRSRDYGEGELGKLRDHYFAAHEILQEGEADKYLLSLMSQSPERADVSVTKEVTNYLFKTKNATHGMDLVSLNIQRGRDHGLPSYNEYRKLCGLKKAYSFDDLYPSIDLEVISKLKYLYKSVDDVDIYIGGIAEKHNRYAILGPTFSCIIANQFRRVKRGDRFWYELGGQPSSFTPEQLQEIRKTTLGSTICLFGDKINYAQRWVFRSPYGGNPVVPCNSHYRLDLTKWRQSSNRGYGAAASAPNYDTTVLHNGPASEYNPAYGAVDSEYGGDGNLYIATGTYSGPASQYEGAYGSEYDQKGSSATTYGSSGPAAAYDGVASGYSGPSAAYDSIASGYSGPAGAYGSVASGYSGPAAAYDSVTSGYSGPAAAYDSIPSGYSGPAAAYGSIGSGYSGPAASYDSIASGYSGPDAAYDSVGSGYSGPAPTYDSTVSGYSGPAAAYDSIPSGYSGPAPTYDSTVSGYSGPAPAYDSTVGGYSGPAPAYDSTVGGYSGPAAGYDSIAGGYSGPAPAYDSIPSGYSGPAPAYNSAGSGYSGPAAAYDSIASGYSGPAAAYDSTASGYSGPAAGYESEYSGPAPAYDSTVSGYSGPAPAYDSTVSGSAVPAYDSSSSYTPSRPGYGGSVPYNIPISLPKVVTSIPSGAYEGGSSYTSSSSYDSRAPYSGGASYDSASYSGKPYGQRTNPAYGGGDSGKSGPYARSYPEYGYGGPEYGAETSAYSAASKSAYDSAYKASGDSDKSKSDSYNAEARAYDKEASSYGAHKDAYRATDDNRKYAEADYYGKGAAYGDRKYSANRKYYASRYGATRGYEDSVYSSDRYSKEKAKADHKEYGAAASHDKSAYDASSYGAKAKTDSYSKETDSTASKTAHDSAYEADSKSSSDSDASYSASAAYAAKPTYEGPSYDSGYPGGDSSYDGGSNYPSGSSPSYSSSSYDSSYGGSSHPGYGGSSYGESAPGYGGASYSSSSYDTAYPGGESYGGSYPGYSGPSYGEGSPGYSSSSYDTAYSGGDSYGGSYPGYSGPSYGEGRPGYSSSSYDTAYSGGDSYGGSYPGYSGSSYGEGSPGYSGSSYDTGYSGSDSNYGVSPGYSGASYGGSGSGYSESSYGGGGPGYSGPSYGGGGPGYNGPSYGESASEYSEASYTGSGPGYGTRGPVYSGPSYGESYKSSNYGGDKYRGPSGYSDRYTRSHDNPVDGSQINETEIQPLLVDKNVITNENLNETEQSLIQTNTTIDGETVLTNSTFIDETTHGHDSDGLSEDAENGERKERANPYVTGRFYGSPRAYGGYSEPSYATAAYSSKASYDSAYKASADSDKAKSSAYSTAADSYDREAAKYGAARDSYTAADYGKKHSEADYYGKDAAYGDRRYGARRKYYESSYGARKAFEDAVYSADRYGARHALGDHKEYDAAADRKKASYNARTYSEREKADAYDKKVDASAYDKKHKDAYEASKADSYKKTATAEEKAVPTYTAPATYSPPVTYSAPTYAARKPSYDTGYDASSSYGDSGYAGGSSYDSGYGNIGYGGGSSYPSAGYVGGSSYGGSSYESSSPPYGSSSPPYGSNYGGDPSYSGSNYGGGYDQRYPRSHIDEKHPELKDNSRDVNDDKVENGPQQATNSSGNEGSTFNETRSDWETAELLTNNGTNLDEELRNRRERAYGGYGPSYDPAYASSAYASKASYDSAYKASADSDKAKSSAYSAAADSYDREAARYGATRDSYAAADYGKKHSEADYYGKDAAYGDRRYGARRKYYESSYGARKAFEDGVYSANKYGARHALGDHKEYDAAADRKKASYDGSTYDAREKADAYDKKVDASAYDKKHKDAYVASKADSYKKTATAEEKAVPTYTAPATYLPPVTYSAPTYAARKPSYDTGYDTSASYGDSVPTYTAPRPSYDTGYDGVSNYDGYNSGYRNGPNYGGGYRQGARYDQRYPRSHKETEGTPYAESEMDVDRQLDGIMEEIQHHAAKNSTNNNKDGNEKRTYKETNYPQTTLRPYELDINNETTIDETFLNANNTSDENDETSYRKERSHGRESDPVSYVTKTSYDSRDNANADHDSTKPNAYDTQNEYYDKDTEKDSESDHAAKDSAKGRNKYGARRKYFESSFGARKAFEDSIYDNGKDDEQESTGDREENDEAKDRVKDSYDSSSHDSETKVDDYGTNTGTSYASREHDDSYNVDSSATSSADTNEEQKPAAAYSAPT